MKQQQDLEDEINREDAVQDVRIKYKKRVFNGFFSGEN